MRHKSSSVLASLVLAVSLTQAAWMPAGQARSLLSQTTSPQSRLLGSLPGGAKVQSGNSPSKTASTQAPAKAFVSVDSGVEIQLVDAFSAEVTLADATPSPAGTTQTDDRDGLPVWLWLLPLVLLGALIWGLSRKRNSSETEANDRTVSEPPEPLVTPTGQPTATDEVLTQVQPEVSLTPEPAIATPEALSPTVEEPTVTLLATETPSEVEVEEPAVVPSSEDAISEDAIASSEVIPLIEEPTVISIAVVNFAEADAPAPEPTIESLAEPVIEALPEEPVIESLEAAIEPLEETVPLEPVSLEPVPLIEETAALQLEETAPEVELASDEETVPEVELDASVSSADLAPAQPIAPPPTVVPTTSALPPLTPPITAGAAGLAMGVASILNSEEESMIEASKYNVVGRPVQDLSLADVDQGLAELPEGYGDSRIVLLPRDPEWAYAYWDVPNEHKEDRRRQGGQRLALRLYDVTDIDLGHQTPHSLQQYDCEELARDWYLPIPVSDRDYLAEIGYLAPDGRWLALARSAPIHIPPVYPSDWVEDQSITLDWGENLRGQTFLTLTHPSQKTPGRYPIHERLFGLAQSTESLRVAGSLFGSMQHVPGSLMPQETVSSFVFPSGMGLWALPTISGAVPTPSGIGFSASAPPIRPRQFWLVADAELIVYGATEPNATVTIGGQPIQLREDGTFRFQLSFQDGQISYPIMAVAIDGEQTRSIHMEFERETPERRTNTREEAQDEWLP